MSFALLPIALPPQASPVGAATPAPSAAAGFEGLMAALFGGEGGGQPQATPDSPTLPGGKVMVAPNGDTEGDAEAQPEDLLPADTQLAGASGLPQAPTPLVASPATSVEPQSVGALTLEVGTQVSADSAPNGDVAALATGATLGATVEGQESTGTPLAPGEGDATTNPPGIANRSGPVTADTGANTSQAESLKAEAAPRAAGDAAMPRPATLAAATATAPATPPAAETTTATPPPSTAAAQASQPLMTAAAAAGVVTLRAGQTGQATTTPIDTAEAPDDAPDKASAAAKGAPAAQPPSPFSLTAAPAAPVASKPETALAPILDAAAAEAVAGETEGVETTSLDGPDSPGSAPTSASGGATTEMRDGLRPVATSATVSDLAAQVARRLEGRTTHFDIQLTPEGLGRVDVRVDINAQGKLTAAMAFDNPHAASEMRGRSADLVRALEQAGFDLSGGLSFNSPQDQRGGGGQFADQAPEREAWQGRAFQSALGVADEADTAAGAARLYQPRRSSTGVDVRI
ncbi:MAG: flagellar hook-length control protein FliK [Phenylobacterium sp.]|nr:flagellar hook-length control protein FliK [Phenylobacterium sp.]